MKKILIFIVVSILLTTPKNLLAQDVLKIAAVVNNKIISFYDLKMRTTLMIMFSELPNLPETRMRIRPQILKTMIDEELQLQEAKRIGIKITDKETNSIFRRIEKKNKFSKGILKNNLAKEKVDVSILHKRIRANLSWTQLVSARYSSSVIITDEEINENLSKMLNNEGKPEYLVSEIFLPVENPKNETLVLENANRLVEQIKSGASFSTLAKQFSESSTAINGGNIGWRRSGQLDADLDNVLELLQPKQISQPIRTIGGYHILYLRDQRTAIKFGQPDPESATINLQQLFVPISKKASKDEAKKAFNLARATGQAAKNCKELEQAAKNIGSPLSGNLGNLKISTLGIQQKRLVSKLPLMKASEPHRAGKGIIVLMVCRRDESKALKLSTDDRRNRIEGNLRSERLDTLAQQYIQELRRNAFLDVRL